MPLHQSGHWIGGGGEDEGEGGHPFRDAAAAMLKYMDSNLTLAAAEGRTGRHRHGGGGGRREYRGGGGGDYLGPFSAQQGVRDRRQRPRTTRSCAGYVSFPPETPTHPGRQRFQVRHRKRQ